MNCLSLHPPPRSLFRPCYLNTNSNCNARHWYHTCTHQYVNRQTHTHTHTHSSSSSIHSQSQSCQRSTIVVALSCSVVVVDHTGCIIAQLECRDKPRRAVKREVECHGAEERRAERVWDKPGTQTDSKSNCMGRFQEANSERLCRRRWRSWRKKSFFPHIFFVKYTAEHASPNAASVALLYCGSLHNSVGMAQPTDWLSMWWRCCTMPRHPRETQRTQIHKNNSLYTLWFCPLHKIPLPHRRVFIIVIIGRMMALHRLF